MKAYLNIEEMKEMFSYVGDQILEKQNYLTELDQFTGDGDHGRNMAMSFHRLRFELPRMHFTCVEDVMRAVGTVIMDIGGGASGVLFGTLFVSGTVRREKHFVMTLEDLEEILRVSLDALISRGKAKPGDKTMIDALDPAIRELERCAEEDVPMDQGLARMAEAARVGMEKTKDMPASFGRTSYRPDRGVGMIDPGAASIWIIFQGMADWAQAQHWDDAESEYQVTTLMLNPCIDRTIDVDRILQGGTHKVLDVQTDVSGKGINVSTVLKHFGITTRCLGFNYSEGARTVERALDSNEIPYDFVRVPGHLRNNIKIFEKETRAMTEFNERGLSVPKEALRKLLDKIDECAAHTKILTLSGSMPEGVPFNTYRNIIESVNLKGCITILDTSGAAFREGLKGIPYLVKPNVEELKSSFAEEIAGGKTIDDIVRMLLASGISYICLSAGNHGAYLAGKDGILYAEPLDIEIRGVQGAGDSMVAGMSMAILQDKTPEEMLAIGMAAAGGSLERRGTKLCEKEDLERLLPLVHVRKVDRIDLQG